MSQLKEKNSQGVNIKANNNKYMLSCQAFDKKSIFVIMNYIVNVG